MWQQPAGQARRRKGVKGEYISAPAEQIASVGDSLGST